MTVLKQWEEFLPDLLAGLWLSVRLAALALGIGLPGGLLLAIGASTQRRALRILSVAVVEVGRGTPALVVLQMFYFGLPSVNLTTSAFMAATLALAVTAAAYTSEIIRGGLQAVPRGEVEAAESLGMNRRDTLRHIVVPQGLRIALPALMGFAILLLQATSLAYTISVAELASKAFTIGSQTSQYLSVLTLAGLLYAAITIPASFASDAMGRRLGRHL